MEEHSLADKEKEARARNAANQRTWRQRLKDDPEKYEQFKERWSVKFKEWYERIKEDPGRCKERQSRERERFKHEYQDLSLRDRRAFFHREWYRERVSRDPEFLEKTREQSRRSNARRSDLSRTVKKLRN